MALVEVGGIQLLVWLVDILAEAQDRVAPVETVKALLQTPAAAAVVLQIVATLAAAAALELS